MEEIMEAFNDMSKVVGGYRAREEWGEAIIAAHCKREAGWWSTVMMVGVGVSLSDAVILADVVDDRAGIEAYCEEIYGKTDTQAERDEVIKELMISESIDDDVIVDSTIRSKLADKMLTEAKLKKMRSVYRQAWWQTMAYLAANLTGKMPLANILVVTGLSLQQYTLINRPEYIFQKLGAIG